MLETVFTWTVLFGSGCAVIFSCLMLQDLWRQRWHQHDRNAKVLRVTPPKRKWHPMVQGYDCPELLLEDVELRSNADEEAKETKAHA